MSDRPSNLPPDQKPDTVKQALSFLGGVDYGRRVYFLLA